MGAVYLYPCGMVLSGLYRMISPFLDARMRAKVKMVTSDKELCSLVPPEYVPTWCAAHSSFGGTLSTRSISPSVGQKSLRSHDRRCPVAQ
eukprot:93809-Prymnesium_polylepis.1